MRGIPAKTKELGKIQLALRSSNDADADAAEKSMPGYQSCLSVTMLVMRLKAKATSKTQQLRYARGTRKVKYQDDITSLRFSLTLWS